MNSCIKSCVSLISLVKLSSARFRSFSSCGFICTTKTAKSVLSSCIARKALANSFCSGDKDSIASLNSLGVGIVESSRGISSSSLFCTKAAYFGSKVVEDETRPMRTMKELNWRARDTKDSLEDDCPENLWSSQACRWTCPPKEIVVEAFKGKVIVDGVRPAAVMAQIGLLMLLSSCRPKASSSMLMVPSGPCFVDRRMAKLQGVGW
mmetsp:Transcript_44832/g.104693  ORF Transcript_44832/g.104693 Transcript_44832/m.104693 type:complete len:207 (-) Transcript_44832:1294-1914(-)